MSEELRPGIFFAVIFSCIVVPTWILIYFQFDVEVGGVVPRALGAMFFVSLSAAGVASVYVGRRVKKQQDEVSEALDAIAGDGSGSTTIADAVDSLSERVEVLSEQKQRLSVLVDGMGDAVLMVDVEERVVVANEAARAVADLSAGDRFEQTSLPTAVVDCLREVLWSQSGKTVSVERDLPVGSEFFSITVSPIVVEEKTTGAVALVYDVTELRRLERIRRDFVANLSHEIRTPIAVILSSAETLELESMELGPVASDFAATILRHAHRMSQMVDDLLTLSRLEAEGGGFERKSVLLRDVVADVVRNVEPLAKKRAINLRVEPLGDAMASADADAITRVLQNLAENAIKYTPEGGDVIISGGIDPRMGEVSLTVTDTGRGIEPEHIARIFERFYRVDEGRSTYGTGLGLAIVKHLMNAMSGTIHVESTVGLGSTFVVRFPIATRYV